MTPSLSARSSASHPERRVAGLDALRSLAIVSVIAYHLHVFHDLGALPKWLENTLQQGWMGVDLFFVLSGFLIGAQFLRPYTLARTPALWPFYRDRIFRILPAYFSILALYLFVPLWRETGQMSPAWKFLTMTENIFPDEVMNRAFSHAWSLCVEMHFYLIFPVVVLLMMRRPSWQKTAFLASGLALLGLAIRACAFFACVQPLMQTGRPYGYDFMAFLYYPTYSHCDGLLMGVLLAVLMLFRPALWSALTQRGLECLLAGTILLGVSFWIFASKWHPTTPSGIFGTIAGPLVQSVAMGLLLIASVASGRIARLFKIPGCGTISTLAYTLYLVHKELLHLVDRVFPALFRWNRLAWVAVYVASCLLCALALHLGIERPFLRLRSRLRQPRLTQLEPQVEGG
jgi:peptidoglycan/LPS O-acetylase OafA/YrhL